MLNHICESDSVRVGLCSVYPGLGGQYGGQRSSVGPVVWDKMKSVGEQVH